MPAESKDSRGSGADAATAEQRKDIVHHGKNLICNILAGLDMMLMCSELSEEYSRIIRDSAKELTTVIEELE